MSSCRWKRPFRAGFLLGAWLIAASPAACGRQNPQEASRSLVDGLGRTVRVPLRPERIVSLAPSVTESLLALGARDRLVGVTDFCVVPPGGPPLARVGGLLNPSLETIRSLRPDLLVATTSGDDPALAREADALGVPLYAIHTPDVESVLKSLQDLGRLIGEEGRGRELVVSLRSRLKVVSDSTAPERRVRSLFVVWGDPLVVPGRSSFLTDALARAGADSITSDAPAAYPSYDIESAIARAPDAILTTAENRALLDRLRSEPAWSRVPAVRSGRLFVVSERIEQPGPEVVSGIEEVARLLHPAAFGPPSTGR